MTKCHLDAKGGNAGGSSFITGSLQATVVCLECSRELVVMPTTKASFPWLAPYQWCADAEVAEVFCKMVVGTSPAVSSHSEVFAIPSPNGYNLPFTMSELDAVLALYRDPSAPGLHRISYWSLSLWYVWSNCTGRWHRFLVLFWAMKDQLLDSCFEAWKVSWVYLILASCIS